MKYLLDTNVFREIGRHDPHPHVRAWLQRVDDDALAISVLTVREVVYGIEKLRQRNQEVADQIAIRVQPVFLAFAGRILPIDGAVAEIWGAMLADSGRHRDDAALAATAQRYDLVLVTRNLADFTGRGVSLLDPFRPMTDPAA